MVNNSIFATLKIIKIFIFLLLVCLLTSCDGFNKLLKSTDYELKMTKAKEYYDKEHYIKSSQLYEELIPVVKGTDKAEEVYYYYSWSEYNMGDFIISQYHFKNFTKQFPLSKHSEECYFMNAYCYFLTSANYKLDQTSTKNAINEFQSFVDIYPESNRIDTCNILIDKLRYKLEKKDYEIVKLYYKVSDWKAAIVSTKNFVKEYPSSAFNEEIYYLMINSYYLLAINSIKAKKEERLDLAIENYIKFVDLYPKSSYLSRTESIYNSCNKLKENLN
ncbi:MAG: outer membrane protein assembly factor BamD [Bacteroidota bacterium]|nr:outer membrane protein assembly factor BamD [Bacteroidota bacterium]MDP3145917.1 outer membrane protein assembly factor BamD [Bacteroidota bacterium]MDP3558553.1 outer membrane protein assembly factor BamD [Bacteroidota bacterium]